MKAAVDESQGCARRQAALESGAARANLTASTAEKLRAEAEAAAVDAAAATDRCETTVKGLQAEAKGRLARSAEVVSELEAEKARGAKCEARIDAEWEKQSTCAPRQPRAQPRDTAERLSSGPQPPSDRPNPPPQPLSSTERAAPPHPTRPTAPPLPPRRPALRRAREGARPQPASNLGFAAAYPFIGMCPP